MDTHNDHTQSGTPALSSQACCTFTILQYTSLGDDGLARCAASIEKQTLSGDAFQVIYLTSSALDCSSFKDSLRENTSFIQIPGGDPALLINQGIRAAAGEYLCFLEEEDTLSPDTLMDLDSCINTAPVRPDVVRFPTVLQGEEPPAPKEEVPDLTMLDLNKNYASQPCSLKGVLLKKSLFEKELPDESLGYFAYLPWLTCNINTSCTLARCIKGLYLIDPIHDNPQKYKPLTQTPSFFQRIILEPYSLYERTNEQVPLYVQHSLARNIGTHVLDKENPLHKNAVLDLTARFSDTAIWKCPSLNWYQKCWLLHNKYSRQGKTLPGKYLNPADLPVHIDVVTGDETNIIIEGFLVSLCMEDLENTDFFIEAEKKSYSYTPVDRSDFNQLLFGSPISIARGFSFSIPVSPSPAARLFFKYKLPDGKIVTRNRLHYRKMCCLSEQWPEIYSAQGKWIFSRDDHTIFVQKNTFLNHLRKEIKLYKSLLDTSDPDLHKAVRQRMTYQWKKLWKRKQIWLISDKTYKGDDNGEALFLYLCREKPKDIDFYFVVEENSPDFERLSREGKVVPYFSKKHQELFLLCDYNIGAYLQKGILNPIPYTDKAFQDVMGQQNRVFIQHGVTHNKVIFSIQKYRRNFTLIICAAQREYNAFLQDCYHFTPRNLALTGFSRYDRLYNDPKKIITFAPTWRRELCVGMDYFDVWTLVPDFEQSTYYKNVTGFINDQRLLDAAQKLGYTIQFVPHPVHLHHLELFRLDPRVYVPKEEITYRDIFAASSLMITDYSSVAFDFAYLKKPVVYFQFDKEVFFQGSHYMSGYFQYEADGFGEVTGNVRDTVDLVIEYMKNDCKMKELYVNRVNQFFAFHDKENCRRVYEAIRNFQ